MLPVVSFAFRSPHTYSAINLAESIRRSYPEIPIVAYCDGDPDTFKYRNIFPRNTTIYGPREIICLAKYLGISPALFQSNTYSGAKNAAVLLSLFHSDSESPLIICLDDDETIQNGFIQAHIDAQKKRELVIGPYSGHRPDSGLGTLYRLLQRYTTEIEIYNALNCKESIPPGLRLYGGGNMSRSGISLRIPYMTSSPDTYPIRGEDNIFVNMFVKLTRIQPRTIEFPVVHIKTDGTDLRYVICCEIVGHLVEQIIINKTSGLPMQGSFSENYNLFLTLLSGVKDVDFAIAYENIKDKVSEKINSYIRPYIRHKKQDSRVLLLVSDILRLLETDVFITSASKYFNGVILEEMRKWPGAVDRVIRERREIKPCFDYS